MKPIFLVIVGSAMLMPAMHQVIYNKDNSMSEKKIVLQNPRIEIEQAKPDSDVLIHDISFWIDRLP
jgi:hypothetical protein